MNRDWSTVKMKTLFILKILLLLRLQSQIKYQKSLQWSCFCFVKFQEDLPYLATSVAEGLVTDLKYIPEVGRDRGEDDLVRV